MFRPGDVVTSRLSGRFLTIDQYVLGTAGTWPGMPHPVLTDKGPYDEADLQMAHPTCRAWLEEARFGKVPDPLADVKARLGLDDPAKLGYRHPLRDVLDEIVERLKKDKAFDFNGHWKHGERDEKKTRQEDLRQYVFGHGYFRSSQMLVADAEKLDAAVKEGRDDVWVNLGEGIVYHSAECPYCGEDDLGVETNGKVLRIVGACSKPEGLPPNEFELNVPSGKLVVANDLRELFPVMGDHNINALRGLRATAQDYAAAGMAHAFVGSSCPALYALPGDQLKVAKASPDEYWDGKQYVKYKRKPKFKGEQLAGTRLAGICTDLWWYSICDYDEFVRRCTHFADCIESAEDPVVAALENWGCKVVDVRPGVYRFRHDDEADRDPSKGEVLFTLIERVRDPDPVRDFLSEHLTREVTAGQYVQRSVAKYPSLYTNRGRSKGVTWADLTDEEKEHAWQRVANHLFCTNGNGVDWHERGFPKEAIPAGTPDIPVPAGMFRRQCHWYPMSEGYAAVLDAAGITLDGKRSRGDCPALAPSFAKLAFQVLESMISFGVAPHDNATGRDVKGARRVMVLALRAYRALGEKYPEHADPKYLAWVQDGNRADKWIEAFDLGIQKMERHVKNFETQRVLPEDAEYLELDFSKMTKGYFSDGKYWTNKASAKWFALRNHQPNGLLNGEDNGWFGNAGCAVPLYSVARVVRLGQQAHTGERIVEVSFDYGTEWMRDATKRKAFNETEHKGAVRVLSREEYESLLPRAQAAYEALKSSP